MYNCELCEYSTKLRADWSKHVNTKYHLKCVELADMRKSHEDMRKSHETEIANMRKSHEMEIADLKKSPRYDSIEDVMTTFFLNAMFMNQTKKDYELQDFGKWIIKNRIVCKSICFHE